MVPILLPKVLPVTVWQTAQLTELTEQLTQLTDWRQRVPWHHPSQSLAYASASKMSLGLKLTLLRPRHHSIDVYTYTCGSCCPWLGPPSHRLANGSTDRLASKMTLTLRPWHPCTDFYTYISFVWRRSCCLRQSQFGRRLCWRIGVKDDIGVNIVSMTSLHWCLYIYPFDVRASVCCTDQWVFQGPQSKSQFDRRLCRRIGVKELTLTLRPWHHCIDIYTYNPFDVERLGLLHWSMSLWGAFQGLKNSPPIFPINQVDSADIYKS